jgi:hypothetical protein
MSKESVSPMLAPEWTVARLAGGDPSGKRRTRGQDRIDK